MASSTALNNGIIHGWNTAESGWGSGMEANLMLIDTVMNLAVIAAQSAPPVSPSAHDRYLVTATASGDWVGKEGYIALYYNSAWVYYAPKKGWCATVIASNGSSAHRFVYDGSAWVDYGGKRLTATKSWNPDNLVTGAQTSTSVTVTGAAIGDLVFVSCTSALGGLRVWGEVTATNTVTIYLSNNTGVDKDQATSTFRVTVEKY